MSYLSSDFLFLVILFLFGQMEMYLNMWMVMGVGTGEEIGGQQGMGK